MPEEIPYFRPPSEMESFLVRVMEGCPHNKCTFCGMYKTLTCKTVPLGTVLAGIEQDALELGPDHLKMLTSLYLEGGDPIALPMNNLRSIIKHAHKYFPYLNRIASYSTAKSVLRKNLQELKELADMGLKRVHMGLESGCDEILQATNKGCTRDDILRAGVLLIEAGIENDVSLMLGIGGPDLSRKHAEETASLLNIIQPVCVRIRTFVPMEGTPLCEDYVAGRFTLMDPYETLIELRVLASLITSDMEFLSEHWSNFINFSARLPTASAELIRLIDYYRMQPRESFREIGLSKDAG